MSSPLACRRAAGDGVFFGVGEEALDAIEAVDHGDGLHP